MGFYQLDVDEALAKAGSTKKGLTNEEAAQRLSRDGYNRIEKQPGVSLLVRFFRQLINPMIIILLIAAAISAAVSVLEGESLADVIIILSVVLINAVLGVYQESKAEQAIEALERMMSPTSRVIRDGHLMEIPSETLVVGDVLDLQAGDAIPADARIVESAGLSVEEAPLTGESVPVEKTTEALVGDADLPLGDRRNMAYMGCTVVYGHGRAVVAATGMQTEMGKIAGAIAQAVQQETPLQRKLSKLSQMLSIGVVAVCIFLFVFSLLRGGAVTGERMLDAFLLAVSLAVAAIPEGLAAVVTIVLSIGVTRMAKRGAIIRRLTAVETLGCAQIICSDKTGTLTQNKMTVVTHVGDDEAYLARGMALCSDAEWEGDHAVGEPTEAALVTYAAKLNQPKAELVAASPRVFELPFDSLRKMMSTLCREPSGEITQFTKGAPDEVLSRCTHIVKDGSVLPLTDALREETLSQNRDMANRALRVLALAARTHASLPDDRTIDVLENGLTFIGMVGMIDPVRPEVKAAIEECHRAGIRPIMITGDHKNTALAIAGELGLIRDASEALTGAELSRMSDEEFMRRIGEFSVYARVQPEHKTRIVSAWQKHGKIVAMTGDGVNDAPSIQQADIGVGMGITGTDVTKNVADMVLADDNFATIISAVEEGRRIDSNIRKAIQFLLSSNLAEVIGIFIATLLGFTLLLPAHILWINLITDSFPALALGMEPLEPGLMKRAPRDAGEGVLSGGVFALVIYQGFFIALITLAAYLIGHYMEAGVFSFTGSADGMTMAFLALAMAEVFHAYNMRSLHGSVFSRRAPNRALLGAMVLSFVLSVGAIYIPPLARAFGFQPISLAEFAVAMGLALLIIPLVEVAKALVRATHKKESGSR